MNLFISIRLLLWKVQFVDFAHAKLNAKQKFQQREYTPPKSGKYSFILFQKEPLWIHLTVISITKKGRQHFLRYKSWTFLWLTLVPFLKKWNFRAGEAQFAVDGCQMLQLGGRKRLSSGIYQRVSALNFPLLSPNCFCWNILCIFGPVFSSSSVHGVLSEISVTVTARFNLLCLSMIIRLHKFVAVLLRNNETFEYRGNTNMRLYPENSLNCQQKCSSASLRIFLLFQGATTFSLWLHSNHFSRFQIWLWVTLHQILRSSAVGPRPSLSLSTVRADRSHHIVTCPPPSKPPPNLLRSTAFRNIIHFSWVEKPNLSVLSLCDGAAQMARWLRLDALWYSPVMLPPLVAEHCHATHHQRKKISCSLSDFWCEREMWLI